MRIAFDHYDGLVNGEAVLRPLLSSQKADKVNWLTSVALSDLATSANGPYATTRLPNTQNMPWSNHWFLPSADMVWG
jgi:hypothetical protein